MTEQNQIKVAQSNDLTNGRVDFIPLQIDIFYVMLSKVGENDPWTGKYRTSVQELKNLGGKSVNHTRIETAIRGNRSENLPALASTFWEVRGENGKWNHKPIFSEIDYDSGRITFQFNEAVSSFLHNLKGNFTLFELSSIVALKGKHTKKIFQLVSRWSDKKHFIISIKELRELLYLETTLLRTNDFKRKVLEQSKKEINEKTDLTIDYKEIRVGRKLDSIEFIISQDSISKDAGNKKGKMVFDGDSWERVKKRLNVEQQEYLKSQVHKALYDAKQNGEVKNDWYVMRSFVQQYLEYFFNFDIGFKERNWKFNLASYRPK
ncbi:replication initiation protein [Persicobacter diffluens]|uniref:Initiator Rep protein WH1 domain-containing protein n=1 Tax=Persicobacter diffluens TaxID=981 RepID=A0AAN4W3X2_9BACT|nr:hypothetical protein PEDI_52240 [Persicobacter diffluens]